jgi:hypothetical protein
MFHLRQNEENSKLINNRRRKKKSLLFFYFSGFRIADESSKNREYFYCLTRDEMAKWMNKMGLAAINFNMDDSKIGGFHKGFVDSREGSPASTPILGAASSSTNKHQRAGQTGSIGDSENDSDKESVVSWHKSTSHHSSISDTESPRDKVDKFKIFIEYLIFIFHRNLLIMINELIYHLLLVMHVHHHQLRFYLIHIIVRFNRHQIVLSVK